MLSNMFIGHPFLSKQSLLAMISLFVAEKDWFFRLSSLSWILIPFG